MKDWSTFSTEDELQRADNLLNQADALLGRRQESNTPFSSSPFPSTPAFPAETSDSLLDHDDDLPILTDIVDEQTLDDHWQEFVSKTEVTDAAAEDIAHSTVPADTAEALLSPPAPDSAATFMSAQPEPTRTGADLGEAAGARLTEALIALDTEIARSIEEWMEREFPQFLERELALMQTRLHQQLHQHLNATLLSEISTHISHHLSQSALLGELQD